MSHRSGQVGKACDFEDRKTGMSYEGGDRESGACTESGHQCFGPILDTAVARRVGMRPGIGTGFVVGIGVRPVGTGMVPAIGTGIRLGTVTVFGTGTGAGVNVPMDVSLRADIGGVESL